MMSPEPKFTDQEKITYLNIEIQTAIVKSNGFAKTIKEAKTNAKKNVYKKRLAKNNSKIADMLVSLDRYQTK